MPTAYSQLVDHFARLYRIEHALTILQWDQLVMMPPGGTEPRTEAIAELSGMHHEFLIEPRIGELLDEAETAEQETDKKISLREMRREYQWAACIPSDLVRAKSRAGSICEHNWRSQRQNNDWRGFLENFREVVNLSRQEAILRKEVCGSTFATPYDALLDLYCTGDSSELLSEIFAELKKELPPLIEEVVEKQAAVALFDEAIYPIEPQKALNRELAAALGFDFTSGRMDESSHPFSTGTRGDHRITTRFREDDFLDALKATAHETGHASYESGLPAAWEGLPAGQACNLSIHESQSLLFEKQLFVSKPFINYFMPIIHRHLSTARDITADQLWRSCTRVQPDLIRIEADELCYPLHIVIRYEIESALINGELEPDALPEAWNQKMHSYLGMSTEGNYKDGCLQDIHWTDGTFGYFPAYTLGAMNGAQIFAAFCRAHGDWQDQFVKGEVQPLRDWLKDKIWSRGSLLESQELLISATGETTNPAHFLNHVRDRYLNERY